MTTTVASADALLQALHDGHMDITIDGTVTGMPSLTLPPGVTLRGGRLVFGGRGIRLTTDNILTNLTVETPDQEVAISLSAHVESLGVLVLRNVTTRGQIALIATGALREGHVVAEDVTVESADVRGRERRAHAFGVDALQGAFTLWNTQESEHSKLTAELRNVAAGMSGAPIRGSGVVVGGAEHLGGRGTLDITVLTTGAIVTDGGISPGTPDVISGGVFVLGGARVLALENHGPVFTLGPNDMALDNWGAVDRWTARRPVTTAGPSGIGFVNFGRIGHLRIDAPIQTHGNGARGFNLYGGSINDASFESITTHGDGAVGVQISRPLPRLRVKGSIRTNGSVGSSLLKGRQVPLSAMALSIEDGGSIEHLSVGGSLATSGSGVATIEVLGDLQQATISGGVQASGPGAVAVRSPRPVAALEQIAQQSMPPHLPQGTD